MKAILELRIPPVVFIVGLFATFWVNDLIYGAADFDGNAAAGFAVWWRGRGLDSFRDRRNCPVDRSGDARSQNFNLTATRKHPSRPAKPRAKNSTRQNSLSCAEKGSEQLRDHNLQPAV
jgi:hypothetical protein